LAGSQRISLLRLVRCFSDMQKNHFIDLRRAS
jgi:hypothetical protein